MGGAMSSSCSSSQVAPRICDLFCQSAPIHSSLQSYSTLQLYSTTFSTNLLPATSSLPPAHPPPALFTTQPPTFLLLQTKSSLCLIERLDFQMLTQKSWCYKSQLPCIHFCVWSNTSVVLKHSTLKISAVKSDNYNLVKWPSCGVFSVQSMWPNDLWPFLRDHQLERQKIVGKLEIMSCLQTLHFNWFS